MERLTQLREKDYKQKSIESAIRSMYKEKYPEEDEETFDSITQDFWDEEAKAVSGDFDTMLKGMLDAKWSGKETQATRMYNYMIKAGLSNKKIDDRVKSIEVAKIKEDPLAQGAVDAYAEGDYDTYSDAIESILQKNYFRGNIESAIRSLYEKAYGKEEEESFENITNEYWEDEKDDESGDYELMFNAFMHGSRTDYNAAWNRFRESGEKDKDIRSSMRSRLKNAYRDAKEKGDSRTMQKARQEFLRLGGRRETLEKL